MINLTLRSNPSKLGETVWTVVCLRYLRNDPFSLTCSFALSDEFRAYHTNKFATKKFTISPLSVAQLHVLIFMAIWEVMGHCLFFKYR